MDIFAQAQPTAALNFYKLEAFLIAMVYYMVIARVVTEIADRIKAMLRAHLMITVVAKRQIRGVLISPGRFSDAFSSTRLCFPKTAQAPGRFPESASGYAQLNHQRGVENHAINQSVDALIFADCSWLDGFINQAPSSSVACQSDSTGTSEPSVSSFCTSQSAAGNTPSPDCAASINASISSLS